MADKTISALTSATTPLAGTEVLPIVQSGTTVKVAVSDLTAARAVATAALSATGIILTTDATDASSTTAASLKTAGGLAVVKKTYIGDNIVQATAAKGINFTANTPSAGMTNQLLNWYEEGTWTPVVYGDAVEGTGTYTTQVGNYTRIGRQVTLQYQIVLTAHTGSGNMLLKGLPFPIGVGFLSQSIAHCANLSLTAGYIPVLYNNNTGVSYLVFGQLVTGGAGTSTVPLDTAFSVRSSFTYFI